MPLVRFMISTKSFTGEPTSRERLLFQAPPGGMMAGGYFRTKPLACHLCYVTRIINRSVRLYLFQAWYSSTSRIKVYDFHNLLSFFSLCFFFLQSWISFSLHQCMHCLVQPKPAWEARNCLLLHWTFVLPWLRGKNDCSIYRIAGLSIASILYSPINKFSSFNSTFSTS